MATHYNQFWFYPACNVLRSSKKSITILIVVKTAINCKGMTLSMTFFATAPDFRDFVSFSGLITSVGYELIFLLSVTRNYVVSDQRGFLFLLVLLFFCGTPWAFH